MNKIFVDSNLWIYALLEANDKTKNKTSVSLIESLIHEQIIISIQVIKEVHWTLQRKYKLSEIEIKKKIQNGIFPIVRIVELNNNIYLKSAWVRDKFSISFWDSLILSSAIENDCSTLYSEDLQHGLIIQNKLNIMNPFK
ncbi:MAG: PIN domain-containing protein [Bacteroidales bacterium]|nr:PIN domain-containing protein [Bacteroidales bacterium]